MRIFTGLPLWVSLPGLAALALIVWVKPPFAMRGYGVRQYEANDTARSEAQDDDIPQKPRPDWKKKTEEWIARGRPIEIADPALQRWNTKDEDWIRKHPKETKRVRELRGY